MDALDTVLVAYLEETESHLTLDEVKEGFTHLQPLVNSAGVIGIFGYEILPSKRYGSVAIVKLVYVFPEHRAHFKPIALGVLQHMKSIGITRVEIQSNNKIHNWMRKHLNSRPYMYVHALSVDESIDKLVAPRGN